MDLVYMFCIELTLKVFSIKMLRGNWYLSNITKWVYAGNKSMF